jgi:hypothetical protein
MKGPPSCVRKANTIKCRRRLSRRKAQGGSAAVKVNELKATLATTAARMFPGSQHDNHSNQ